MIWLTGCNGMLGSDFKKLFSNKQIPFVSTDLEVDIAKRDEIGSFLKLHKDISHIVNCAAYTAVDKAEEERGKAMLVNGKGPGNLAELCRENRIYLYHVSTDYVFPGTGETPWEVDSPKAPVNVYGESKLLGENKIIDSGCNYAIFRTQWLYGGKGENFVDTIKRKLLEGTDLTVVDDQVGAVTWTEDLTKIILFCITKDVSGVYHAVNAGYAS